MQTDLIPSEVDRYFIGWFYLGVLGIMFMVNLLVVMSTAYKGATVKLKQYILKRRLTKALENKIQELKIKENKPVDAKVNSSQKLSKGAVVDGPVMSEREELKCRIGVIKIRGADPVRL
jgi:hypothetical protein